MKAIDQGVRVPATSWRDRAAMTLTNGVAEATLLPGGGHLARWGFASGYGPSQNNVLWEAPWTTADPDSPAHSAIAEECEDKAAGKFLASYTGHALCLDGFGPAGAREAAAGVSLHGEASNATWTFTRQHANLASGIVELPVAGLQVERKFSLIADESVLRVEERVTNLRAAERALHWVQHATFGAPFFASGSGRATASIRDGITWPLDYNGCNLLRRDAEFTWPYAPGANGETVDLREIFTRRRSGFVAAAQQTPGREHGFVAVCHAEIGLAVGYLFRAEHFPWVTLWEENHVRNDAPWRGQVQARGMEFGTTPLPLGNDVVDARGPLLGSSTSCRIEAHETLRAPWLLFIAAVPSGWREIEDIHVEPDEIVLIHAGQQIRVPALGALAFLRHSEKTKKVGIT
ncbi:aldose 1-epimerase family protein [Edaphobacter bradus]|uniref:aldose 1-epimerase family protein n=1 Tax=Edaphobacter bradus TaxID=2259016 RepID=UPI0021DF8CE3|nr:aldose 1-epimerase family protein [Edaphobacter bradus]